MIGPHTEVYVATAPVNLHLSFDRLVAIVREQLGSEPSESAVFVFHNRPRTHVKTHASSRGGSGTSVVTKGRPRSGRRRVTSMSASFRSTW
ncbi:MAG: IS66 family insertion sequence element accessory protein TnpB [Deltaproteobacteria bacterium]